MLRPKQHTHLKMSDQYPLGFTLVRVMGAVSAISTFPAAIHSSLHIARLISKHGSVEDLNVDDPRVSSSGRIINPGIHPMAATRPGQGKPVDPTEFKKVLLDIHAAVANKAKADANLTIDLLGRLAI